VLGRFESNVRLIEQGVIESPPAGADLGTYIVSGGKLGGRPSRVIRVEPKTLADLFDGYLAAYPKGAKEASTWRTERIHIGHLRRLLDTRLPLDEVTPRMHQDYRTVPMSPKLEAVMRTWFADHPGGQHAICTLAGTPITEH
jgi:hypothetical protein